MNLQSDHNVELNGRGINIGAGRTYIPNLINIDFAPYADISLDLNKERLPFEDNSIDLVFTYHTLEHLDNYLFALAEIYRVMKHGARLLVGVPYITLTQYNLINPYHRQNFNEYSFDFFDPKLMLGSAAEPTGPTFRKVFHRFHYLPEFNNKSEKRKEWCRRHLFNVVQKIDFGLIALKQGWPDIEVNDSMPAQLLEEFDKLLRSRKKYSCGSAAG
jgi:SAM-dependent methyltransferase